MSRRRTSMPSRLDLETAWGVIRMEACGGFVVACTLPRVGAKGGSAFRVGGSRIHALSEADRRVLERGEEFLRAMLRGEAAKPPAHRLPEAGEFTKRVWASLGGIPRGEVREYGEIAKRLGRPGGARAVGNACGANPLPLVVPCHRVVAKGGAAGGFSSGLAWKRLLLKGEGYEI